VQQSGVYEIDAFGGAGGQNINDPRDNGGNGAHIKGEFILTAGDVYNLVIGQLGGTATAYACCNPANGGGGGGGASFIWKDSDNTLLIAAGGGGASGNTQNGLPNYLGMPGTTSNDGTAARDGTSGGSAGSFTSFIELPT